jgi:hypothetical protein
MTTTTMTNTHTPRASNPLNTGSTLSLQLRGWVPVHPLSSLLVSAASHTPCVDARALWEALGKPHGRFRDWAGYYIKPLQGREEAAAHIQTRRSATPGRGGRPRTDYLLSGIVAEELARATRTREGDQVRYFARIARLSDEERSASLAITDPSPEGARRRDALLKAERRALGN